MGLENTLNYWERYLIGYPGKPWLHKFWRVLNGTRPTFFAVLYLAINMTLDFLKNKFPQEAGEDIRAFAGTYSAYWAKYLIAFKQHELLDILRLLRDTEKKLLVYCDEQSKVIISDYEKTSAKYTRFILRYTIGSAICCFVIQIFVYPAIPAYYTPPRGGIIFVIFRLYEAIAGMAILVPYFIVPSLLRAIIGGCVALYKVVGRCLTSAGNEENVKTNLKIYQDINLIFKKFTNILGSFFLHYLVGNLVNPLVSVYDIIGGHFLGISTLSATNIFIVFIPLCMIGQELIDSSEEVLFQVYCADWFNESSIIRKSRLFTMMRAMKPSALSVAGLGSLNHRTCQSALKTWLSYLQMMLNLR